MKLVAAIACGGAVGALLRFWLSTAIYTMLGRSFPIGTLVVNVLGSLVMGLATILFLERLVVALELRAALLVGVLGAFTTFSTFSMETMSLVEQGELLKAGLNMVLSVSLCVVACWVGMVIGRQV